MPTSSDASRQHRERRLTQQQRYRKQARLIGGISGIGGMLNGSLLMSGGYDSVSPLATWALLFTSVFLLIWVLATRPWRIPRMQAPLAQEVLDTDLREPVVYLRPFEADLRRHWYEGRIARSLKRLGPVVTVGRPEEKIPATEHMAREYLLGDEWQEYVLDLTRRAQLVVIHAGTSAGLAWEVDAVLRQEQPQRLIVCFGYNAVPVLVFRRRAAQHYRQFSEKFSSRFPKGLPAGPDHSMFLAFGPDWNPIPSSTLVGHPLSADLCRLHRRLARPRLVW